MSAGADLRRVRADLEALPARALAAAGPAMVRAATEAGRRAAPRGIAGARLGARLETRGDSARLVAVPRGPWAIANNGARAHRIGARDRVLAGGLRHPVTIPVTHPGARGRGMWPSVEVNAAGAATQALELELRRALRGR